MSIVRRVIAIALLLVAAQNGYAQVGRDSSLWTWTNSSRHHDAIVRVSLDGGSGTGVIIRVDRQKPVDDGYEGYCLTAHHVVEADRGRRAIKVSYANGRTASRCKVIGFNSTDAALLWVWVPSDIAAASLGDVRVHYGDAIELAGLGGSSNQASGLRSFSARASAPTNENTIYADVPLLPGDSGGPVFNQDQQVVGVISGGWFWFDRGIQSDAGHPISLTWPARAANLGAISELVAQIGTQTVD